MEHTPQQRLTSVMMRIRRDHPFFGTLGLFTIFHMNDSIPTAATDGKDIWLNPEFVSSLEFNEYAGLVVHELLHAALQHCSRRCERNSLLWNIAADIVVNGTILNDTDYALPEGVIINQRLCNMSVEEIYEQLRAQPDPKMELKLVDLLESNPGDLGVDQNHSTLNSYWRSALSHASAIAMQSGSGYGSTGLGLVREIEELDHPTVRWQDLLWQYAVSTPYDYSGFDRRFVWRGLYLDDITGEKVDLAIAIDTSGSIGQNALSKFLSEIQGIIDAYPHIQARMFYADSDLYGPYVFSEIEEFPQPKGGGGTSFVKFFEHMANQHADESPTCIYFTDGYGEFPKVTYDFNVIWVISEGGIPSDEVPFGEVVRLGF